MFGPFCDELISNLASLTIISLRKRELVVLPSVALPLCVCVFNCLCTGTTSSWVGLVAISDCDH